MMTESDRLQIEAAASGGVSGTLATNPLLEEALERLGYTIPYYTTGVELQGICQRILQRLKIRQARENK